MKATLILENGAVFTGTSIGCTEDKICEMVFNTSMVGYQELLTDPCYAGQGVVMSYPLIGNYGVNDEDNASGRVWVEALVVRHLSERGSNFRCQGDLNTYLQNNGVTGIQGVDTRALTKILRNQGSMNALITCAEHFNVAEVMDKLKAYKITGKVAQTTCDAPKTVEGSGAHVAVLDFGVTCGLVEHLTERGCKVALLPADTKAEAVLGGGYNGVILSPGPGDPAENTDIIAQVKKLYDSNIPLLASVWATRCWLWPWAERQKSCPMVTGAATSLCVIWSRARFISPARTTAMWWWTAAWMPPLLSPAIPM